MKYKIPNTTVNISLSEEGLGICLSNFFGNRNHIISIDNFSVFRDNLRESTTDIIKFKDITPDHHVLGRVYRSTLHKMPKNRVLEAISIIEPAPFNDMSTPVEPYIIEAIFKDRKYVRIELDEDYTMSQTTPSVAMKVECCPGYVIYR